MSQAQVARNPDLAVEDETGKSSQDSPSATQSEPAQSREQGARTKELRTGAVVVGRIADGENNLKYNQDAGSHTEQYGKGAARQVCVCKYLLYKCGKICDFNFFLPSYFCHFGLKMVERNMCCLERYHRTGSWHILTT
jgi:hypothetical protein